MVALALQGKGKGAMVALIILGLNMIGVLYLGLRWPADVVVGLLLGWFSVLSGRYLLRKYEGKCSNLWR